MVNGGVQETKFFQKTWFLKISFNHRIKNPILKKIGFLFTDN